MSSSNRCDAYDDCDEETLPGFPYEVPPVASRPTRDVRVHDFKDGRSAISVEHGPSDPSRVWITFDNREAFVHLSLEEGMAIQLGERLKDVLSRFQTVRSMLPSSGASAP